MSGLFLWYRLQDFNYTAKDSKGDNNGSRNNLTLDANTYNKNKNKYALLTSNHSASKFVDNSSTVTSTISGVNSSFTLAIKMYMETTPSVSHNVIKLGDLTINVETENSIIITDGTSSVTCPVSTLTGQWKSLVVTYNSGAVELYIDGIFISAKQFTNTSISNLENLKLFDNSTVTAYSVFIAEDFRIYNTVLTADRIYTYSKGNGVLG